eukprot:CAMPEP_0180607040 /NCGR_PEP_ID=MMETSP1037_2-20121125/27490_1 /TAXON_ID=632150 /ORGANISM="Azadinium spinosum, Strain 3D9" /LENGTH=126 /DNA_ID=CAMNT_0022626297 /DNA_START=71 /DNA_END=451 /DNA_ORIENTATION=+
MSADKGLIWAVFKLLVDGSLPSRKHQVLGGHTIFAKARFHHQPGIVCSDAIEISALPVLALLTRHGNLRIDVASFPFLVPPVDLHHRVAGQRYVENMERLALSACLKRLSHIVVDNVDQALSIREC